MLMVIDSKSCEIRDEIPLNPIESHWIPTNPHEIPHFAWWILDTWQNIEFLAGYYILPMIAKDIKRLKMIKVPKYPTKGKLT